MPTRPNTVAELQEALDIVEQYGSAFNAVKAGYKGVPKSTLDHRSKMARLRGLKPTVKKDEPRYYERKRLGKMHLVIPDVQTKPGVRQDHLEWVGNYIIEKKPDVIVCIGDFADMPSLSSYDRGKLCYEGRRYINDVKSAREGMYKLLTPIEDYNRTAREKYEPRKVLTLGNHEIRISKSVDENPHLAGHLDLSDLGYKDFGWEVHDFLKPVEIDGIEYCHYFVGGVMGRPVTSAAALLRQRQKSATQGHVQFTDMAIHKQTQQTALFCGTCYLHDEDYLGPQGNVQRRQIIVKHEVEDGVYDPMFVSLKFLEKAYS